MTCTVRFTYAPGNPTKITFLPAIRSLKLILDGGKPKCNETSEGITSPTLTAEVVADKADKNRMDTFQQNEVNNFMVELVFV